MTSVIFSDSSKSKGSNSTRLYVSSGQMLLLGGRRPVSGADLMSHVFTADDSVLFKATVFCCRIRSTFGTRTVKSPSSISSGGTTSYGGPTGLDQFAYSFADGDTPVTALSWEAATCAAGTVIAAVDAVCTGAKVNAFCAGKTTVSTLCHQHLFTKHHWCFKKVLSCIYAHRRT